ncbi:peptidase M42 [Novipirellula caenicola]|uniref:M42 glutamyl aminopeptidase n=1 Tax=Novipirellula caenicola TaxID=1536901 RepID=A0ABP9VRS3_9BACT
MVKHSAASDAGLSDFLHLLGGLVREPSVVGVEQAFFRVVLRELEELSVNVSLYHGVLVAQGNRPDSIILSAHVDRHGLLCTGPNEFQYAAFIAGNRGELNGDSVSEQMMELIQDRFIGQRVQSHLPHVGTYLGQGSITRSFVCPNRRNLIFEIDGLSHLQPGTPVSFVDRLTIADGFISAQLDNVLSVAILVHMFRCGFQGTVLFTAGEEAGRSWRYALEWFLRRQLWTQRLIVLDTSPYPTPLAAAAQEVVLRRRDATAIFAGDMTMELQDRCESLGIGYSYKDDYVEAINRTREKPLSFGRTELGRLTAATEGKINGTTLQIPTTSYHTASETASLSSIRAVLRLLDSYID